MSEQSRRRATEAVLERMRSTSELPRLSLNAAAPLETLPPELVTLILERMEATASPFGSDHPRRFIVKRVVVPSTVLAVLDLIGLISAAVSGRTVYAIVAAVLLIVLAYFAFAGIRFVRQDPLRVTSEQRDYVEQSKRWRSRKPWTGNDRTGPWARLVAVAVESVGRIAASDAWTWPSIAPHRAGIELGDTLDGIDAAAYVRIAEPIPGGDDDLVRRVSSVLSLAEALDDLVGRSADEPVRDAVPDADNRRLGELIGAAAQPR